MRRRDPSIFFCRDDAFNTDLKCKLSVVRLDRTIRTPPSVRCVSICIAPKWAGITPLPLSYDIVLFSGSMALLGVDMTLAAMNKAAEL